MAGSCSSARASATFCRMPFDSSAARVDARAGQLEHLEQRDRSCGRRARGRTGRRRRCRFSRTVSRSQSPGASVRNPIRRRSADAGRARERHAVDRDVPLVGAISPASIRSVVVLPAPFGPSSATISDRAHLERDVVDDDARAEPPGEAACAANHERGRSAIRPDGTPAIELVQPGRHEQAAVGAEEQAVRRHDARGAELDGANLVAVAIVHVRVGHDERNPEAAGAVDRRGADRRRDERQFAVARLPLRPLRRQAATSSSISRPCTRRSKTSRPSASYFWNTGSPVWKTKKKPPSGSTSGMPLFSARWTSRSSSWPVRAGGRTSGSRRRCRSYSVTSAPVSGCDIRIDVPVYCSDPMPLSTTLLDHDARLHPARQEEAADAEAGRREDLDALAVVRRVGDGEGPVRRRRRTRSDR